ncbi:MAG: cytochrome c [Hyphomicrobiales bacterium]|nr:cytochrome c [Hyphomicrobiales bacterium]MCP4999045.1 cytochrome c [Hyphomicrobiales bacterium]
MRTLITTFASAALASCFVTAPVAAADTQQVFEFYCTQCHGPGGKGDGPNVTKDFPVSPRNFTNAEEMNKLSDADMKNVIMDGGPSASKSPMMPPWSKTLTEEQVDGLVKHLRVLCQCEGKQG